MLIERSRARSSIAGLSRRRRQRGEPRPSLTADAVLALKRGPCHYCGRIPAGEIDHVIPLSRGGTDDPENIVGCCRDCNQAKMARTPEEWATAIQPYPCERCGKPITPKPDRHRARHCSLSCAQIRISPETELEIQEAYARSEGGYVLLSRRFGLAESVVERAVKRGRV